MMPTTPIEALEAEVLNLAPADRARLLDKLIVSLDTDPAVEAAWQQEARRRDEEIESGTVQSVSADEVLAGLRAGLR